MNWVPQNLDIEQETVSVAVVDFARIWIYSQQLGQALEPCPRPNGTLRVSVDYLVRYLFGSNDLGRFRRCGFAAHWWAIIVVHPEQNQYLFGQYRAGK
jgi:hypothetical protein